MPQVLAAQLNEEIEYPAKKALLGLVKAIDDTGMHDRWDDKDFVAEMEKV